MEIYRFIREFIFVLKVNCIHIKCANLWLKEEKKIFTNLAKSKVYKHSRICSQIITADDVHALISITPARICILTIDFL